MSCRAGRARPVSLWKPGFVELPVSIRSLEFLVVSGVVERQFVRVVPRLRVRARFQQCRHGFGIPTQRCHMQRGVAAFGSRFQIRACSGQDRHGSGSLAQRCHMQRGVAVFVSRFQIRTRRLILMGSYLEHVTGDDPGKRDRLMKGLDVFLERDRDRELFDLAPNKENADGNPD